MRVERLQPLEVPLVRPPEHDVSHVIRCRWPRELHPDDEEPAGRVDAVPSVREESREDTAHSSFAASDAGSSVETRSRSWKKTRVYAT